MNKRVYRIGLVALGLIQWKLVYDAKHLPYDDNYASAFIALLIGTAALGAIGILWFRARSLVTASRWLTLLYVLLCSPASIVLFIHLYKELTGMRFFAL